MNLNFNSILIFSEHPKELADFYGQVLQKDPDMDDGEYFGFLAGNCFITIGKHDKVAGMNLQPERLMINFETDEVREEFERMRDLGAKVVAKPYQMKGMKGWIATLADTDGNIFQLMPPWKEEEEEESE